MSQKILVTGATGTIGKALISHLKAQNASFIAAARDEAKAQNTLGVSASQVVHFDFSNPETFQQATAGVTAVFLMGPPITLELDKMLNPFVDFLKANNILRVVYLSAVGAEHMGDRLSFHTNMERKLERDGFDYTILKPTFFAQNFKNYEWDNITKYSITYVPAGMGKAAFVDVQDIAAVAAAALTQDGHSGKTYEITGPESLSYADAATLLTEVTGKPVAYPSPSPEAYAETLKQAGAPDFIASYMIDVYSIIARNLADRATSVVEQVTGRRPTALKEVLQRDFSAS